MNSITKSIGPALRIARQHLPIIVYSLGALVLCTHSGAQVAASSVHDRPLSFRVGPNFTPDVGLSVGFDYTIRNAGIGRGFATRFTLEGGFVTRGSGFLPEYTLGIATLDEVYKNPLSSRSPYIGVGIGLYEGPFGTRLDRNQFFGVPTSYDTAARLGGKIFVGSDFTSTTSIEAAAHFTGGQAIASVQLRLKL